MAFYRHMVLLLCIVFVVTADGGDGDGDGAGEGKGKGEGKLEEEGVEAQLPRSVVVVVTPLGTAEQRLLGAAMPTCQRIVACNKDVYPWWRQSRGHCDCPSAVDHTLRQIVRWARESRGMPTAVVTALNPTNATDEPIVMTMSIPEEFPIANMHRTDAELIQSESDFLAAMTGKRKLLWTSPIKKGEEDLNNEITQMNDIDYNNEKQWFEKQASYFSKSSPVNASIPSLSPGAHNNSESNKISSSAPSSEEIVESQTPEEERTTEEEATDITSQSDKKHHHENHTHHGEKCSHGKGGEAAKCSHDPSTSKSCGASKGRGCSHWSTGKKPNTTITVADLERIFDLRGLQVSSRELQHLMFRQWLHSLEPSLSIVTRFRPVGLPLELPLRLTNGLPRELTAYDEGPRPRMRLQQQHVLTHNTESALLAATRKALQRLEAAAIHGHGSLLIVRSLAPLSGAELAALLMRLGVDVRVSDMVAAKVSIPPGKFTSTEPPAMEVADELGGDWSGGGGFSSEQLLAGERLVAVLNGCPTVFDNGLDLFAHGPRAEDLQKITTLEHLDQAIQNILSSTTPSHDVRPSSLEELTAVELPRAHENFPRVRLHVTRVRSSPCAGRICIMPAVELCRHPAQKNCIRPRREATTVTTSTTNTSPPDTTMKRKRRAPNSFWRVISELRRLRQHRWLTSRHRKSTDLNRPEEETEDEFGGGKIKIKEPTRVTKDPRLVYKAGKEEEDLKMGIKKKRQAVDDPKKEDEKEAALTQASKVEEGTKEPEEHPREAKEEESREPSESSPYTPDPLEKEKEREATKAVEAGEQIIQQKTNIPENQTKSTQKTTISDEDISREHSDTEPAPLGTKGTDEDDDTEEREQVTAIAEEKIHKAYDDSSTEPAPQDLLIEAHRRGVEDDWLKSSSRPMRESASPLAAFAFTPLLLVLAR